MSIFYSAMENGFFTTQIFGEPTISIIDPAFEWPMIDVPDTNAEPPMIEMPDPEFEGEGEPPMITVPDPDFTPPLISVRDPDVDPPMIDVPNPDCQLPKDAVAISEHYHQQLLAGQGSQRIEPDADGYPVLVDPQPISIEELAKQKRAELDQARDAAFAKGLEYNFDGKVDVVQSRLQDKINLLGLRIEAQELNAAGITDPVMPFRAESNTGYQLTPQQMIDLTNAALAHIQGIYQQSWQLKDSVDQASTPEEVAAIEWQ